MGARLVAAGITVLALSACGQNRLPTAPTPSPVATTPATPPVRLTITADRDRILSTESVQLSARAVFADGAELRVKPAWVVDDSTVAVVNETGIVKGVGAGVALVVAVSQGLSASFSLRVDPDVQGVWTGTAALLTARCNDFRRCGTPGLPLPVTVTVARSGGTATATLEQQGSQALLVGSISGDGLITLSGRFQQTVNGFVSYGSDVIGWRTRIDKTGAMTGEYTIAAEVEFYPYIGVYQLQKATKAATPTPSSPVPTSPTPNPSAAALSYLTMSPDLSTLLVGRNQTLSANGVFADGTARPVLASWSVDNSEVATVTQQGVVLAKRLGVVTVTASAAGMSVTRRLTTMNDLAGWWEGSAVVRSCTSRLADSCKSLTPGTTSTGVTLFVDQQGQRIHALALLSYLPPVLAWQTWIDGSVSDDGTMTLAGEGRFPGGGPLLGIANWKSSIRDDGTMSGTFTGLAPEDRSAETTLRINLDLVTMRHTRVVPNRVP